MRQIITGIKQPVITHVWHEILIGVGELEPTIMKKLWMILPVIAALSCNESKRSAESGNDTNSEERVEESSGENITPQLHPDDSLSDTRHDIDTISSAEGADKQSARDSVD